MKPQVTFKQLRYFVVVANELHFGRASELLHITQPALSRQIAALERQLNVVLLDRHRQIAGLTPAGRQFLQDARSILASLDDATSKLRVLVPDSNPVEGRVWRLGYTEALDVSVFPDVRSALVRLKSREEVEVSFARSAQLIQRLRRAQLDLAFIGLPATTTGLACVQLGTDPMAVAVPDTHRLARRKQLSLTELTGESVFWFRRSRNPVFFDHAQRVFAQLQFEPRWRIEPHQHHLLLSEVARGAGLGLVPRSMTRIERKGVRFMALREGRRIAVETGLVWRPSDSDVVDNLVREIRSLAAELH